MSFKSKIGKTLRSNFMSTAIACGAMLGVGGTGYYIEAPGWDESNHPDKEQIVQQYHQEIQDLSQIAERKSDIQEEYTMASIEGDPSLDSIKKRLELVEKNVDDKADILASKILVTQKIDERDLAELSKAFNSSGLAEYSDIKLDAFYANYRNELLEHEEFSDMDATKVEAFSKVMAEGKGYDEFFFLFVGMGLMLFSGIAGNIESGLRKSKTLEKWADEKSRPKPKSGNLKRN